MENVIWLEEKISEERLILLLMRLMAWQAHAGGTSLPDGSPGYKTSAAFGMEISAEKSKLMTNSANGVSMNIRINGEKLDKVKSFKYLGAVVKVRVQSMKYCPELHRQQQH